MVSPYKPSLIKNSNLPRKVWRIRWCESSVGPAEPFQTIRLCKKECCRSFGRRHLREQHSQSGNWRLDLEAAFLIWCQEIFQWQAEISSSRWNSSHHAPKTSIETFLPIWKIIQGLVRKRRRLILADNKFLTLLGDNGVINGLIHVIKSESTPKDERYRLSIVRVLRQASKTEGTIFVDILITHHSRKQRTNTSCW